ncbi:MAG: hypothetical protein ACXACY_17195 [Candidatus Hodarchaeales archaeon]|jgi:quercetin dioxygenase-like cupin family protein
MVKVNGKDIVWKDTPKGHYLTDVKEHVLWEDESTGAMLALRKIPVGSVHEHPHVHPDANHWMFLLSGEATDADGTKTSCSEGDYMFMIAPQGEKHGGGPEGRKFTKEIIGLWYFDGPQTKVVSK